MAVVMIGMAEVSVVDFDTLPRFEKGQETGRFHFGGSMHCLIFGPNVDVRFEPNAQPRNEDPVPVLGKLATAVV
ncbi:phosphatidylserine decarboxylase [Coniosporium apollinis CBS 100218]|uniref:Phosphatidylserine decarboxylase n=1 Tax=Coniosporium apollinis (strain CBS 100218) TaxID=1168221 RepID=R7Z3V5_CONA1|nr:phosphatidylserine decarboxylase [Coniosporium apollinis CBS 100218]EON68783.1 phosphatidylserine decarboxylase [Coniosporium apollinis CBS 100218]